MKKFLFIVMILLGFGVAACGTVIDRDPATPNHEAPDNDSDSDNEGRDTGADVILVE